MVYFSFEFEPLNLSITDLLRMSLLFFVTDKNLNDNEFLTLKDTLQFIFVAYV